MASIFHGTPFKHRTAHAAIAAIVLITWCGLTPSAWAQNGASPSTADTDLVPVRPSGPITAEHIQVIMQEVQTAQDLDEALKTKGSELCQSALLRLESAATHATAASAFQQSIASTPQEIERINASMKSAGTESESTQSVDLRANASANELEQHLAKELADQAVLKTRLADLELQIKTQQERPEKAREQLTGAKNVLGEIDRDIDVAAPKEEHPLLTDARRAFLASRKLSRSNEVAMLEQELLSQPARLILLKAERDLAGWQLGRASSRVEKLQLAVNEQRRVEAERARTDAEQARRDAIGKHPAIRRLAEINADLAKSQAVLVAAIERVTAEKRDIGDRLNKLDQQFDAAKEKLDIAGLTDALGPVLREQRKSLPDMRHYNKHAASRKNLMSVSGLEYLRIEEERRELSDIRQRVQIVLAGLESDPSLVVDLSELEAQVHKLLEDRRSLLDQSAASYGRYLSELASLNFEERQLVERANQYATFLDERLLWIPSTQLPGWGSLNELFSAVFWLVSPSGWAEVGLTLWVDATSAVLWACLAGAIFLAMLVMRRRLWTQIEVYNGRVGTIYADSFWITICALTNVVILAAPVPFVMGYLGWRLNSSIEGTDFTKAIGAGLTTAAVLAIILTVLRKLSRDHGVAQVHLHWRQEMVALIRRTLWWALPLACTAGFVVAATERQAEETYRSSLGRFAFVVGMLGLAAGIHRLFRGPRGIIEELFRRKRNGWMSRLLWVWYPWVVSAPLALAGLSVAGYYYTAYELAHRLLATVGIVGALVVAYALVMRWLFVARQKLEVARARERRAAAQAPGGVPPGASEVNTDALEPPHVTIEAINEHTRRLLRAVLVVAFMIALWLIWLPVLPALHFFDDLALWHQALTIDGNEVLRSVTLTDLVKAVLIAIVTSVAARNVPGVLELAVLQRLPLDPGSRYAIATTCRYVITAIGVVIVFNTMGIGWSKVQWLVAALGVGLGFGLQEIVANFVSGLIILFERPIRVGDTVTVGNVTGTVSRIQIRATTITDWDRKELIVPNKEFVTGQLINWSLSDSILRQVVRVGVAYGSDIDLTRKTLLAIAKKHPHVLADPPATLIFEEFGDSSLNFDLRVFVSDVTVYINVRNDLHVAIDKAFREAGIEIAFPQRDVHMNTTRPLDVRIVDAQRPELPQATD